MYFKHFGDRILIEADSGQLYRDALANFLLDIAALPNPPAYPGLPDGAVGWYFEPGRINYVTDGATQRAGPDPSTLNRFLGAVPQLVAAKTARETPPPPPAIDPVDTPTSGDDLARALIAKGLLTQADIDDAKRTRP